MSQRRRTPRPPRTGQEIRSQAAFELLLNAYALFGAIIVLRSLMLALGVDEQLWIGQALYSITSFFVLPFTVLPGNDVQMVGNLTVADVTLLAVIILFPILLLLTGSRFGRYRDENNDVE